MSLPSENPSPFGDKKTFLAIGLVFLFFVAWQSYLEKKYPKMNKPPVAEKTEKVGEPSVAEPQKILDAISASNEPTANEPAKVKEEVFNYENEFFKTSMTSKGMGLLGVTLKKYKDKDGNVLKLVESDGLKTPYATYLNDFDLNTNMSEQQVLKVQANLPNLKKAIDFEVKQTSEHVFEGVASIDGFNIVKKIEFKPQLYSFSMSINVENMNGQKEYFPGLLTYLIEPIHTNKKGSFFIPSYDFQEFVGTDVDGKWREQFDHEEVTAEQINKNGESYSRFTKMSVASSLVGLSEQYFASALLDHSDVKPFSIYYTMPIKGQAVSAIIHKPVSEIKDYKIDTTGFVGPKSLNILKKINKEAESLIDFGWFSVLARPMLTLLKWFYGIFGNWGFAIIGLTLIVRVIVLPLHVSSYKSMKKMQTIQGPLKEIRERYKDDPTKMNQEVMALMRSHGANPLGGCLPMVLQFPVFIALYQVLSKSIELYQQPFMLWIHDLSTKDPYYVLPIGMGVAMFLQQKLTPSVADPKQKQIQMIVLLIFPLFMISLPSGLTLYIFISTVFGVTQQLFLTREKSAPVSVEAKA